MTQVGSEAGSESGNPARTRLGGVIAIVAAVVAADQLTKHWAVNALSNGDARHVLWTLQFNLSFNRGMAFSAGRSAGPIIGALALVVVVVLLLSVRRSGTAASRVGIGLIAGGALGNVVDRLFRGEGWLHGSVVDFIDFQWFPIFNIADSAINVGGAILVLAALFDSRLKAA